MTSSDRPLVLSIEDNRDTQQLIERLLSGRGYDVVIADNELKGIQLLLSNGNKPDLILLDVMMPEMNGYEFCSRLQENEELSYIPVVFLTALGDEQDKAKAFALGAVDYVQKPIFKNKLLEVVDKQLQTNSKWRQLQEHSRRISAVDFVNFKQFLFEELALPSEKRQKLGNMPAAHLYKFIGEFGIDSERLARYISNFLNLKYVPSINYTDLQLGILPAPFCRMNSIVAVKNENGQTSFVLSNPFNLELLDHLSTLTGVQQSSRLVITDPKVVIDILNPNQAQAAVTSDPLAAAQQKFKKKEEVQSTVLSADASASEESEPIIRLVNQFIENAYTSGIIRYSY